MILEGTYLKLGGQVVLRHASTPNAALLFSKKTEWAIAHPPVMPLQTLVFIYHTFIKACCKMKLQKIFSRRLIL